MFLLGITSFLVKGCGVVVYGKCISCPKLDEHTCAGPPLTTHGTNDMIDWCNARLKHLRWTHRRLADEANVALGTIDNFLSGHTKNPTQETIRPILLALGCGMSEQACLDERLIADLEAKLGELQNFKDESTAQFMERTEDLRRGIDARDRRIEKLDAQVKALVVANQRQRKTIMLSVVLIIAFLVLVIIALIVDRATPGIGFIWT